MIRLPTLQDFSEATEDSVLKLWEGLGYYRRVKNFHKAAKQVVRDFGGNVPENKEDLLNLPGIGDYTAAAISSIAYRKKEFVVDGNVQRFFSRLFDWEIDIKERRSFNFFVEQGRSMLDYSDPRLLNQAVMEIGSTLCLPKTPHCNHCPVQKNCLSKVNRTISLRPVKQKRESLTQLDVSFYLVKKKDRFLLQKQRDWWQGMWLFPWQKNLPVESYKELSSFSFFVTKFKLNARVFGLNESEYKIEMDKEYSWFSVAELKKTTLPSPGKKILQWLHRKDHE